MYLLTLHASIIPRFPLPTSNYQFIVCIYGSASFLPSDAASFCPQDIVAGDMSKRDLWEQKGGPKTSSTVKVRLGKAADAGGGSSGWAGRAAVSLRGSHLGPGPPSRQSTPSGKRYKFVAAGHGKYEKVLVDEGSAP